MALRIQILRLLMYLGYPPLIMYFVPLVLYNHSVYKFSPVHEIVANILPALFMLPQYATCFLFLVFHVFITLCRNQCTVILVVFLSSCFSFFAGVSLATMEKLTSNFQLKGDKQEQFLFSGFVLLALIQFIGYSYWLLIIQNEFSVQTNNARWQPSSHHNISCFDRLKFGIFTVFACFGFLSFISYSVSVTSVGIAYKYSYSIDQSKQWRSFHAIVVNAPILLYPVLATLQIIVVAFKKVKWVSLIIVQIKNLLDFFLGFTLLYFTYDYYISQLFQKAQPDMKTSYIFIVVSCLSSLISNGLTMLSWSNIWWSHLKSSRCTSMVMIGVRDGSIFDQEHQPLLSSARDM